MILSREEFSHHFNALKEGLGNKDSPLWIPDDFEPSEWFVCVEPIGVHRFKSSYYDWCNKTLKGPVRCYSSDSDDKKEWWGFTNKEDIVLWMLKWM
jgi:hypothetical protein